MKTKHRAAALILIGSVFSCTDLHKDPIGLLTPEQISTDPTLNSVKLSVTSSYQMLASTLNMLGSNWDENWAKGVVFRDDFVLHDIASDDMKKKWSPDGDQPWMDQVQSFNFTASNPAFNGQWTFDYEGISRANLAISYLTDAAITAKIGIDPTLKNTLLGEAYFLRAFYYFDLVNDFGDVPLLVKPLQSFSDAYAAAKRETKANVYAQISTDLAQAKTLLPNSKYSDATEEWRASRVAVLAMQAKVALYNEKWSEVISIVTELEGLNFRSLNPNYFDSFDVTKEATENEVIFFYDHQSAQIPSKGNGLCAPLGWGFIAPTASFLNEFEPDDPRLLYTVDAGAQFVFKLLGSTNTSAGYKGNEEAPSNKIYIRLADVLLWKAEAYNETGSYPQAIAIINTIRNRARTSVAVSGSMPPAGTLPDRDVLSVAKDQIKGWLIHERRVELGFESQRFNDLKRWKIASQVLTPAIGKNFKAFNYLYPIPQSEFDKSGGTITQNPGY